MSPVSYHGLLNYALHGVVADHRLAAFLQSRRRAVTLEGNAVNFQVW